MSELLSFLNEIDGQALLWFNSFHVPVLDRFMMLFTGKWEWVPMYAALLYMLCRTFPPKRVLVLALGIVLSIVIADQTCATLLRPVFQRMRPANLENPLSQWVQIVDGYRGGSYGFPSCHAANTFALSTFIILATRRQVLAIFMAAWTLATCYTRMYLGVHYPGDLIAGSLVGMGAGALCFYLSTLIPETEPSYPDSQSQWVVVYTGLVTVVIMLIISLITA